MAEQPLKMERASGSAGKNPERMLTVADPKLMQSWLALAPR
jgi:hypothetical protein